MGPLLPSFSLPRTETEACSHPDLGLLEGPLFAGTTRVHPIPQQEHWFSKRRLAGGGGVGTVALPLGVVPKFGGQEAAHARNHSLPPCGGWSGRGGGQGPGSGSWGPRRSPPALDGSFQSPGVIRAGHHHPPGASRVNLPPREAGPHTSRVAVRALEDAVSPPPWAPGRRPALTRLLWGGVFGARGVFEAPECVAVRKGPRVSLGPLAGRAPPSPPPTKPLTPRRAPHARGKPASWHAGPFWQRSPRPTPPREGFIKDLTKYKSSIFFFFTVEKKPSYLRGVDCGRPPPSFFLLGI